MKTRNPWFLIAAAGSFAIALLHLVIIFIGASAYRFFGAGEGMATHAEAGSLTPAVITLVIVFVFVVFGLYSLSAAGVVKRLWKLKPILMAITAIYLLRGFGFFVDSIGDIFEHDVRHAVFSFTSFAIGIFHLAGLIRGWKSLSVRGTESAV